MTNTTSATRRTIAVSWDEMHRQTRALARNLSRKAPWAGIVAVTRGGLVPAAIAARELGIRRVETLCVASYDDRIRGDVSILSDAAALTKTCGDGDGWLVIEDIADTGNTIRAVRNLLPRAHVAAVYVKPEGRPFVDSFAAEVPQDDWIQFPWDAPAPA